MSKLQCLFIGGVIDGSHCIVDCDLQGNPVPLWHVPKCANVRFDIPMEVQAAAKPEVEVYTAQKLMDQQGRAVWVYTAGGLDLISALIGGYRRPR